MKPTIFLRIASVLTLVHSVLHTIGGVFSQPDPGPGERAVLAMKTNQFLLTGLNRSYWDFYRGLGLTVTIFLTAEALVFWLLASVAKKDALQLRPVLWVFAAAYLVFAVNSFEYFFAGPVIAEVLIAACLLAAIFTSKPAHQETAPRAEAGD